MLKNRVTIIYQNRKKIIVLCPKVKFILQISLTILIKFLHIKNNLIEKYLLYLVSTHNKKMSHLGNRVKWIPLIYQITAIYVLNIMKVKNIKNRRSQLSLIGNIFPTKILTLSDWFLLFLIRFIEIPRRQYNYRMKLEL
jgi:hypothetical protein